MTRLTEESETAQTEKSDALSNAAELDRQLNQTRQSLAGTSAEVEKLRATAAKHEAEVNKARADTETATIKKVRAELNQANQRAMESGASLRKEKEAREAAEARINEAESKVGDAEAQRDAVQAELTQAQEFLAQLKQSHQASMDEVEQRVRAADAKANQYAKAAGASSSADGKLKALSDQLQPIPADGHSTNGFYFFNLDVAVAKGEKLFPSKLV